MAENPIKTPLPADLPEDWTAGQIVAPTGEEVGLSKQHGYNYLMQMVNRAQQGVNAVGEAFETVSGKRTCRVVVGTSALGQFSTIGWTAADCDFLCDGVDDQVEIQAAIAEVSAAGGGEIVLLNGQYHVSKTINFVGINPIVMRGNGQNTQIFREFVSEGSDTKDTRYSPTINITNHSSALKDLSLLSTVDDDLGTQILCGEGVTISNVFINCNNYGPELHHTGVGIYAESVHSMLRIENCSFSDQTKTSIMTFGIVEYLSVINCKISRDESTTAIMGPKYFINYEDDTDLHPGFHGFHLLYIAGNLVPNSGIRVDVQKDAIISGNACRQIEVNSFFHQSQQKGNGVVGGIICGNVLCNDYSYPPVLNMGIILGPNTEGWFVTGNQVQYLSNSNPSQSYFAPIEDSGTNNIVRFNSNDTSAGGTVGPAGPAGKGVPTGGASGQILAKKSATDYDTQWIDPPASGGGGTAGVTMEDVNTAISTATAELVSSPTVRTAQVLTQAEYTALTSKRADTLYLIKE